MCTCVNTCIYVYTHNDRMRLDLPGGTNKCWGVSLHNMLIFALMTLHCVYTSCIRVCTNDTINLSTYIDYGLHTGFWANTLIIKKPTLFHALWNFKIYHIYTLSNTSSTVAGSPRVKLLSATNLGGPKSLGPCLAVLISGEKMMLEGFADGENLGLVGSIIF